jgi:hypothetical protein
LDGGLHSFLTWTGVLFPKRLLGVTRRWRGVMTVDARETHELALKTGVSGSGMVSDGMSMARRGLATL